MSDREENLRGLIDKVDGILRKKGVTPIDRNSRKAKLSSALEELLEQSDMADELIKTRELLRRLFEELGSKLEKLDNISEIKKVVSAISNIKFETKTPIVNIPSEFTVRRPTWLEAIRDLMSVKSIDSKIEQIVKSIKTLSFNFPKKAEDAIPVRLSDGEKFYSAITQVFGGMTGGGGSTPKVQSTTTPSIYAVPVVNPDGSNVSGGVGGGDASAANQTTQITAEQAIQTSVEIMDDWDESDRAKVNVIVGQAGIAAGTGVDGVTVPRVTLATNVALPAGTNAIGKLAANSGVDIGDVDVTSVSGNVTVIQGTATNLKAQAEAYQGGSAVAAGNPLQVTLANGTVPSHAVTNAGTFAVQESGSALTALQLIDDVVAIDDTTTHSTGSTKGALIMAAATPTDASVNANDLGAVAMTTDRKLHVSVQDSLPAGTAAIGKLAANSGVDIGDVDVTSVIAGTGATNLGKAEDDGHTSGDTGVMDLGVRVDTPNATVAANGDYHYKSTDLVGGVRTALYETDFAVLGTNHVKKYYTNAGAVTDGIIWSPAAGKRWYVTDIYINVSAAATVTIEDDKAGGDEAVWKGELAANSGWSHSFQTPWFSGEDAADLLITTSAGNVYVTVTGYEI